MDKYHKHKYYKNTSLFKLQTESPNNIIDEDNEKNIVFNKECEQIKEKLSKQLQLKEQIEFDQNIIEERNEEIQQICNDIYAINEIFKDLNKMVESQTEPINQLEEHIDDTLNKTEDGIIQLKQANDYHKSWFSKRNKLILLSIAGLSVNIPVTILFGLKAGVISGVSTVGLSAISSIFSN